MPLVQVKPRAQVTLPFKIRERLGIKEGDYLEADIEGDKVILVPQALINKFTPSTLSEKGKQRLDEALQQVKTHKVKKFKNVEDLINELHQ